MRSVVHLEPAAAPASGELFTGSGVAGGDQIPGVSAAAYVVADAVSGQILAERNAHARRHVASTTKITTAMVALDLAPSLDCIMHVPDDLTNYSLEYSQVGFKPGDSLTVRQMLEGLLLISGDDAAEAFARAFVPEDQFLALMNRKAQSLGLQDTHYVNPSGLDDDQEYSSAYDLAVLTRHALTHYPAFAATVDTKFATLPLIRDGKPIAMENFNYLLGAYPGVVGVKTGWTDPAGRCLVLAYRQNGRFLIITLLGSQDHMADGTRLLDWARTHLPAAYGVPLSGID
jgi:D-alanyl-D-alanine carboxypeptidase/D-alanyl-D-alanine carboxypeptidase (penicillin-binding protein 5/6)